MGWGRQCARKALSSAGGIKRSRGRLVTGRCQRLVQREENVSFFRGERWHSTLGRQRHTWRGKVRAPGSVGPMIPYCIFSTVEVDWIDPAPIESVEQMLFCVGTLGWVSGNIDPSACSRLQEAARRRKNLVASTMFRLDCVVVLIKVITCRSSILRVDRFFWLPFMPSYSWPPAEDPCRVIPKNEVP